MTGDITALIPPPLATDARVVALLTAFEQALDHITDMPTVMLDPATVPDAALPYLALEHSLDEFVGPGLPPAIIRAMIARAWDLHEPKGYAEGIEGALATLGFPVTLTQWWQETPQAARGTHRVDIAVGDPLWPETESLSTADIRAIWRMIHAMQRWSQHHGVRLTAEAPATLRAGAGVAVMATIDVALYDPGLISVDARQRVGAGCLCAAIVTIEPLGEET